MRAPDPCVLIAPPAISGAGGSGQCELSDVDQHCLTSTPIAHPLTIYNGSSIVDGHSMGKPNHLVQGTLGLLILKTIAVEPKHGWAIGKRIQQVSSEVLQVQQGSLYPALHRLEQNGWIEADWAETETGRKAKFYSLTQAGRAQLKHELAEWDRLSMAVNAVVHPI
jgi:PadR family transcriptional regulator PadR